MVRACCTGLLVRAAPVTWLNWNLTSQSQRESPPLETPSNTRNVEVALENKTSAPVLMHRWRAQLEELCDRLLRCFPTWSRNEYWRMLRTWYPSVRSHCGEDYYPGTILLARGAERRPRRTFSARKYQSTRWKRSLPDWEIR